MRAACLIPALLVVGCFSEPPSSVSESDGSTSASSSSGTSGTSAPGEEDSSGGSSSTGYGSVSFGSSTSSSTGETPPEGSFCASPANDDALFCTDFDNPMSPSEWPQLPAVGYDRTVEGDPAPFSPPRFVRLARNSEVPTTDPVQALFEGEDVDLGRSELRLHLAFRLPPEFGSVCGQDPLRLFSFEYTSDDDGSTVRLVGAVSEDRVLISVGPDDGESVLGSFSGVHAPQAGWRTLDVELAATDGVGERTINVAGSDGETGPLVVPGFLAPNSAVDVTVGPWFLPGSQPPDGCNYDIDDIVLLPIPKKV